MFFSQIFVVCQGRSPEPEQEAAEASSVVLGGGVLVDQRFCVEHRHHSNHHRRGRRPLLLVRVPHNIDTCRDHRLLLVRVLEQPRITACLRNLVFSLLFRHDLAGTTCGAQARVPIIDSTGSICCCSCCRFVVCCQFIANAQHCHRRRRFSS